MRQLDPVDAEAVRGGDKGYRPAAGLSFLARQLELETTVHIRYAALGDGLFIRTLAE